MSRPWMPLYVADYRKSTGHLSAAEHGAYLLLIMHYWAKGGLPDDDKQLARIACMSPREWKDARPTIAAFFEDGWRHERIDLEIAHAADVSNKRRAAVEQRERNRSSNDGSNGDHKITQSPSPSPPQEGIIKVGGKGKANGWSPPKHGAQSQKHGTVYIVKGTAEWPPYAEEYFKAHGMEPVPDEGGGVWFKTSGYTTPVPDPKRLERH